INSNLIITGNSTTTSATTTNFYNSTATNLSNSLYINSSGGNVGIGTTTPGYKLDVNGDVNVATGSAYKYNGVNALFASTTLGNFFFANAGNLTTTGTYNYGIGDTVLDSLTSGGQNIAIGRNAGTSINSGAGNTIYGYLAGATLSTGSNNVAIGASALNLVSTVDDLTAIGVAALENNTSGVQNTAVGRDAGRYISTGSYNTAIGNSALSGNSANKITGSSNTAIGRYAMGVTITTAANNTSIGMNSLFSNTTGADNVAIGLSAGTTNTTGTKNTLIGATADVASATLTNATAIGYGAIVGASNSLVLGGTGANAVNVGIGTTTPTWLLNPTSATAPQLSLSAGAGVSQWAFRNAGGNLYLATTTVAGTATSSVSSLSINSNGLLTLPSYGGVTGCAQFDTVGLLSNTGTACGTGGGGTDPFTHPTAGVSATTSSMIFTNASSTFTGDLNITGNSTTTNATTTNFFSTTASSTNLFSSLLTVAGNGLIVDSNRNVGIGTTTPYAKLSIAGTAGQTSPLFQVASSTNSPFFSITSAGDIGIGTTSPFARLSVTGNVALDSNMISFASTSASTLTLNYFASATSTIPNNKLYAWTIATSTTASPIFRIDTTSSSLGSISATTSIKGGFTLDDGAFNYDSYAGITSVDSLSTGPMAFDDNAGILSWIDMPVSTTTADIVMSYSAQLAGTPILTVYGESLGTGGGIKNGRIGIGTTSPYALLSLATTTNQLIDLFVISTSTAGLVFKVDSYGRTFGDGAYSSPAADYAEYFYTKSANLKSGEIVCVDILENNAVKRCERGADNNVMGIVSTKPAVIGNYIKAAETDPSHYTIIGMLGQVDAYVSNENGPINVGDSLTSASSTPGFAMHADGGDSTVGIALESMASSTGKIKVLISRRNKSLVVEEVEALVVERVAGMKIEDKVGQMIKQSVDSLDLDPKITAIARDEAEQAIARLNESFDNLKIQTLASTTLSLSLRLDDIESVFATTSIATSTATSTDESFAGKFFTNLFARITVWLADAANGIGDFFANRVRTKELCVSDESGAETCLSKAQLDALLWNVVSSDTPEETVVEEPAPLAPSDVGAPTEDVGVAEESVEEEEPIVEESVVEESVVEEPVIESVIDVPVTEESIQEPISEPEPEPVSAPAPELVPEPPAVETITP
ncbi:MAG: hypothetical protein Q7K26_02955, partial [bacterium]|nr:hypothetical protein [bacterium]